MSDAHRGTRVLCVDDHLIVREGISLIINRETDLEVVASCATGEEAVTLFSLHQPGVTLMDLQLPRMSGLDAIIAIRKESPDARIVVLTMYEGDEDIYNALNAGAAAYLLKDSLSDDLVRTVREVAAGKRPVAPEIQARLKEHSRRARLTPRESEVLELMAQAIRTKEIASILGISEQTAHVHIRNIFDKLGVNDRVAALNVARRHGIIHPR